MWKPINRIVASSWLNQGGMAMRDLLLPARCMLCQSDLDSEQSSQFCSRCRAKLSPDWESQCSKCGAFSNQEAGLAAGCPACHGLSLPFAHVYCLGNYDGEMRELVLDMKRAGREAIAIQVGRWLGDEMISWEIADDVDIVTPVPAHWSRRLRRGYSVAELLVEGITARIRLPVIKDLLKCQRRTGKQGRLSTNQRFDNVKNCFAVNRRYNLAGKSILLVDDVMTSCATATEAAKIIISGGAAKLCLAIAARGIGYR